MQPKINIKDELNFGLSDLFSLIQEDNFKEAENIRQHIINLIQDEHNIIQELFEHPEVKRHIPNEDQRLKFIDIIFMDNIDIKEELRKELGQHIENSYQENKLNIDQLYQYNMSDSPIMKEYFNTDILSSFMLNASSSQLHEAQAIIYFYIENFNISKSDIEVLKSKTKNKEDFVLEILKDINEVSLIRPPFTIVDNQTTFNKAPAGLPDVLFYNNKNNEFSLGFATTSVRVEHEENSIIKHPTALLTLIHNISKENKLQCTKYKDPKTQQRKAINNIQEYTRGVFYDLIKESKEPLLTTGEECIEIVFKNLTRNSKDHINESFEQLLKETQSKNIKDVIQNINNKGINIKTMFLGKIPTPKKKANKTENYTPEAHIALIMNEAFKQRFIYGSSNLNINIEDSQAIIDLMELRFNTVNKKNSNILKLETLNSEKLDFLPYYIQYLLLDKESIARSEEFSRDTLSNMLIIDSQITRELKNTINNKLQEVFDSVLDNQEKDDYITIDQEIKKFFKNQKVDFNITLEELFEHMKSKHKQNKSDPNYNSIIDSFNDIFSNYEKIRKFENNKKTQSKEVHQVIKKLSSQ